MKVVNKKNNKIIVKNLKIANSALSRFMGLLDRSSLEAGEGLHIIPCNSIHSCFMKFKFDAIFIDKNNQVKHIIEEMLPWRFSRICLAAHSVLEVPPGTIKEADIKVGDNLEFIYTRMSL